MDREALERKIQNLPTSPGVYQYFDKEGRLLYVGKAKNLANRVKSYWSFSPLRAASNLSLRIAKMISETASLEYIVVKSEHDALLLENSLIKQLNPKYNILLRDDKTYPYIYIDKSAAYPRFEITRKVVKAKDVEYFGPYSVGARDILDSIYELCRLVQKKSCLRGNKACLYYQIKKCLAPCEFNISKERYDEEVEKARTYIKEKKKLLAKLQKRMETYAENLRFEEAAVLRDRIEKIKRSTIHSEIDLAKSENYDIFVVKSDEKRATVVRVFMREGKIVSSDSKVIPRGEEFDASEMLKRSILNLYAYKKPPVVAPVLVNETLQDKESIEAFLQNEFGKKIPILRPQRGVKKRLVDLALLNADEVLRQSTTKQQSEILQEVQELFGLTHLPRRIECFDNSHLAGKATVGAMVAWEEDGFDKEGYRRYHLDAKDEYAQMKEMLTRRAKSFHSDPPPDLWVIDGGATLLKLAREIIASSGANVDVIAIAKEKLDAKAHRAKGSALDILHFEEKEYRLKPSDKRLQFFQRLRDEAHRFAIKFHRETKLKLDQESELLKLQGISQAKIKRLLDYFGTFEAIRNADFDEICTILNAKDAKIVKKLYE